jgi:hypothetical protein
VDFGSLARRYEVSGGDIRNAVLKAALAAASEPGRDATKRIHQRHFEQAIEDVVAARKVMRQSLFDRAAVNSVMPDVVSAVSSRWRPGVWLAFGLAAAAFVLAIAAMVVALAAY